MRTLTEPPGLAAEVARSRFLKGQLRPVQRIEIRAPSGMLTRSRRTRVPRRVMRPAILTTGNGLSTRSPAFCAAVGTPGTGSTRTVCESNERSPSLSVTRSPTT